MAAIRMTRGPRFTLVGAVCLVLFAGCGGGDEEFSKPIERPKAKNKFDPSDAIKKKPGAETQGQPAKQEDPSSTVTEDQPPATETDEQAAIANPGSPTPKTEQDNAPQDRKQAAEREDGNLTASGRTKDEVKSDKEDDARVAESGLSLLDTLTQNDEEKKPTQSGPRRFGGNRSVAATTGRLAVKAIDWYQLRNDLARRFFVAATPNGSRIAATTGEKSLGVLSTQVEDPGDEMTWTRRQSTVAASRRTKHEITVQQVTGLSGVVASVEITADGNVILVGTEDGRLIARSSANLQDWDLYSRDLFAWQDEYRASTRISIQAVRVVRLLNNEAVLTVDDAGKAAVWEIESVVQQPISPLDLTEDQAKSPEAPVVDADPKYTIQLPKAPILTLALSDSGQLAAVVTSNEKVHIFNTADGTEVASLGAADFDDTQPVTLYFEEAEQRILVGLADGRIIRRALPGGAEVSGTTDSGRKVDYEVVFAPEQRERDGAVTALELKHQAEGDARAASILYIGRASGVVVVFDLPGKERLRVERAHAGQPVMELRSTRYGLFAVATNRMAKLIDAPKLDGKPQPARDFELPFDNSVMTREFVKADEDTNSDRFTVRRNFGRRIVDASNTAVTPEGIRPSDPILALYEHRLRIADDEALPEIRRKIRELRLGAAADPKPAPETKEPVMVGEITSQLDYESTPLRRALLTISPDGSTVSATQNDVKRTVRDQSPDQPVFVWDTSTNTPLRTWRRSQGIERLMITADRSHLIQIPFSADMDLRTGMFQRENRPSSVSVASPSETHIALGHTGSGGAAGDSISIFSLAQEQRESGFESFESAIGAMSWTPDEKSLFVSIRERTRLRLLELEASRLQVRHEIETLTTQDAVDAIRADRNSAAMGPIRMAVSKSGRLLATYGRYPAFKPGELRKEQKYLFGRRAWQIRIWRREGARWSDEPESIIDAPAAMLELDMSDSQLVFVNEQDAELAMISPKGIGSVTIRNGRMKDFVMVPDISGNRNERRPVAQLSAEGRWAFAGDGEGNVWVWSLRFLKRKPLKFTAHAGPITGLSVSADSQYLATAGEENRIRVWNMNPMLDSSASPKEVARK